jgi:hypothetical protein
MVDRDQLINLIDKNVEKAKEGIYERIATWEKYIVFSDLWWMGVALTIIPWIVWYIYRRKQSTDRLMYVAFYVMITSLVLDISGSQLGFWHYRFNVVPFLPTYFPWDLTMMPVGIITLIQVKPKANPWMKAIIFALGTSYVAEPFFHWLKVYELESWRYSYSVPIQFILFMTAYYLSRRNKFEDIT